MTSQAPCDVTVDGVTLVVSARCRAGLKDRRRRATGTGSTSATQDGDKLAPKVVVEPAVEDWVCTGRAEDYQVTHGKDEAAAVERQNPGVVEVCNDVQHVQRQPTAGEHDSDGEQQSVGLALA